MAHSDCGWTCGCTGKTVKSLENTCHTWAILRWWFTTKRRCIKWMHLYFYMHKSHKSWPRRRHKRLHWPCTLRIKCFNSFILLALSDTEWTWTDIWGHIDSTWISVVNADSIESVQKRALRIIYSFSNDIPYSNSLDVADIASLSTRRNELS